MNGLVSQIRKRERFFRTGINCCQAVFAAFAPELGLDRQTALKIASGLEEGMGRMGEVCGAVGGAFMIIGLKYGIMNVDDELKWEKAYDLLKEFSARFKEFQGSIICRDLISCDISSDEGLRHARDNKLFEKCLNYVESAVRILEDIL